MNDHLVTGPARRARALASLVAVSGALLLAPAVASAGTPDTTAPPRSTTAPLGAEPSEDEPATGPVGDPSPSTVPAVDEPAPPDTDATDTTDTVPEDVTEETTDDTGVTVVLRRATSPSVRDSGIPVGSILLAAVVFAAVAVAAIILTRRRPPDGAVERPSDDRAAGATVGGGAAQHAADTTTLNFLLEMGHALIDAGDAVDHVESTIRNIAEVNGIGKVDVLVLPSALVLSLQRGDVISTEVRTSRAAALRLDQIDDVFRLVGAAERGTVDPAEGRRQLLRIRNSERPESPALLVVAYLVSTVGLTLLLRGGWLEVVLAAALGVLIGSLTLAAGRLDASYQAFWPLAAATIVSAAAFASARVFDDVTIFPVLVSPLIVFLPGGLLTTGVMELSTGQPVSGSSRLAAGAMRLILLALGILAGANLVGVPGGDIRAGDEGVVSAIAPWVGVGLFGAGIAWFNGARRRSQGWILLILYLAYSAQVLGGLFFGSTLSAFFGALAMTPAALVASRLPSGPTPLVTFLPGFWLLVPGALGLEGVTLILGDGSDNGVDVVATSLISMIAISFGILLGMAVTGADASRPWSAGGRDRRRLERVGDQ